MASDDPKPVIGYLKCVDCETRATVHQSARGKGRYFYTRCECGCDQRNGAVVQTRIFNNSQWLGDSPEPPPNLLVVEPTKQPEKEPIREVVEPKAEPSEQPEQPSVGAFLAVVGLVVGGVFMALRGGA